VGGISGGDSGPAAPQVIISWSHASNAGWGLEDPAAKRAADEAWRDEVLEFFVALRRSGIDAEIDLAHFSERGVDWTRWGPTMVRERDVIAVVNAGWRRAWEESGDGFTGRGAAAEVDVLLSIFNEDRDAFQEKVLLVLLPGSDDSDVPYGLGRLQRVRVRAFDDDGLTPLLRILTDQPEYPLPPLGAIPLLPAGTSAVIQRRLDHPAAVERSVAAHDHVGITDSVTVELVRGGAEEDQEAEAELRDEIALLRSALRQVPQPGPGEGPTSPGSGPGSSCRSSSTGSSASWPALRRGRRRQVPRRPLRTSCTWRPCWTVLAPRLSAATAAGCCWRRPRRARGRPLEARTGRQSNNVGGS
jgi:hypothetical protein